MIVVERVGDPHDMLQTPSEFWSSQAYSYTSVDSKDEASGFIYGLGASHYLSHEHSSSLMQLWKFLDTRAHHHHNLESNDA